MVLLVAVSGAFTLKLAPYKRTGPLTVVAALTDTLLVLVDLPKVKPVMPLTVNKLLESGQLNALLKASAADSTVSAPVVAMFKSDCKVMRSACNSTLLLDCVMLVPALEPKYNLPKRVASL